MVMNMNVLTKEQMGQMIDEIEEMGFYEEYPTIVLSSEESKESYSKDSAKLETDGFHTYHVHSGYGLGCFPVHEEYLGLFVGNISSEQMEKVSEWISQIHADMKKWKEANSKLGVNVDLIENVRGMIEYEINILENAFHPIFLDEVTFEPIYIGGYNNPSPYGSHESRSMAISYINESYHKHVITKTTHGGNGKGCFDVNNKRYGVYYDVEYLGIVYNALRKLKRMEREFFSSITEVKTAYYNPEENEVVILKNGIVKSSQEDDGDYEDVTVFVQFDRMSRSGNPVYKKVGDTLTSAVWLRWEEEVKNSSEELLDAIRDYYWGLGLTLKEKEERKREHRRNLMKFSGWFQRLGGYYGDRIKWGEINSIEDYLAREMFLDGIFIHSDREEQIMVSLSNKTIVKEKLLQLRIKTNLQNLEGLFTDWKLEEELGEVAEEVVEEECD